MNKQLSIIIPSCNMEQYLAQCIESLIIPGIDDVEILIINDGSKDRTSEIGHEYEAKYPDSIRVIDKPNGHYGSCINRGLAEATGKYIRVLDADDSFDKEAFRMFLDFIKKQDSDLIISDYCLVDETGRVTETRKMLPQKFDKLAAIDIADVINSPERKFFAMHALSYRLSIFEEIGYSQTEGVAYTDQEWNFSPMIGVHKVSYFPHTVYKYLVGRQGQSISTDVMLRSMPVQLSLIRKRLELYAKCKDYISPVHIKYLRAQLYQPITNTYEVILSHSSLTSLLDDMCQLDMRLKEIDGNLYDSVGNRQFYCAKLKIIKVWRNNDRKVNKSLLLTLMRRIYNK